MNAIEMNNDGYLLLFHGNESWRQLGREELEKYVTQNHAWLEHLMTSGKAKGGQALARTGAMVSGKDGRNVTDGPFAESKEVVGGYFLLNVATFEEAVAIAKTCPTLAFGGKVEVRPLTNECLSTKRLEELKREEQLVAA
ncbi:MAG TPA: YciI family protein [Verrucomicrobiae bacterium]|nr:YciI family protein [Verrucomicrobiae bacterium]